MLDRSVIKAWSYEPDDLIILNHPTCAIFVKRGASADQKPSGEIRIIEADEGKVVNRSPMFLEEVLIRELLEYKNAAMERNDAQR